MAKTLLNGVNDLLKKNAALDSGTTLTSLTDTTRQQHIDLAIQVLNETLDEIYSLGDESKPEQMKEGTITLVTNQRAYNLRTDCIRLRTEYPLVDETNSQYITILEDGYYQIIQGDTEQDDTGLPSYCGISPVNGKLVMNVLPDSNANGAVYKYRYDRELALTDKDDEFPFSDAAYRAIIACAAQLWKLERHQDFSPDIFRLSLGRAGRYIRQMPKRRSYMPSSRGTNSADPFEQ